MRFNFLKKNNIKNWKQFLKSCLFVFSFVLIFILPDYLLRIFVHNYIAGFHANTFIYMLLFFTSLLFIKSDRFFYVGLGVVWLLIMGEIFYYLHFGRYFIGEDILLLFKEGEDVAIGFLSDVINYWGAFLMILCLCSLSVWLRISSGRYIKKSNIFIGIFLIIFAAQPILIKKQNWTAHSPSPLRYMFRNSLKSVISFFVRVLPRDDKDGLNFIPYDIVQKDVGDDKITVIVYMLESVNYDNMSLFGYERSTTPNLDKLKKKKNFYFTKAISSGVVTSVSLPMFFNIQHEPENYKVSVEKKSNLFKLAKSKGFKTVLYSPQSSKTFSDVGIEFADIAIYRDSRRDEFNSMGDRYAFDLIKETSRGDKNFFVVQTRAVHFPYENIYKNHPEFDIFNDVKVSFKINSYDNGILYLDNLLMQLFNWVDGLDGKVYVIITSDHGQMMGKGGFWGHSFLNKGVAEVPFILYTKGVDDKDLSHIKSIKNISHFDIAKFVAGLLGFDIKNPNTPPSIIFVNGVSVDGGSGFLKFKRSGEILIEMKGK